jgi:hypothetical protein
MTQPADDTKTETQDAVRTHIDVAALMGSDGVVLVNGDVLTTDGELKINGEII